MGKKKKIRKITDEQYLNYIAGLKDTQTFLSADGELITPDCFKKKVEDDKRGE